MSVDDKTLQALDLNSLSLPPLPPVAAVEAEDYTDSSGETSLRVLVTLDESADIESLPRGAVGELKSAIRESLQRHGVTVFPYIFLAKPSELAETDSED